MEADPRNDKRLASSKEVKLASREHARRKVRKRTRAELLAMGLSTPLYSSR